MEILNPSAQFLRVSDKFFPEFIFMDDAISRGPLLVYLYLFRRAYRSGACRASQAKIARCCKGSVRSVQHHLKALAALKYISVEPQDDGCNVYRLLLSQRVKTFIAQASALPWQWDGDDQQGAEFSSDHAQNLRRVGENSAPYIKKIKSIKMYWFRLDLTVGSVLTGRCPVS